MDSEAACKFTAKAAVVGACSALERMPKAHYVGQTGITASASSGLASLSLMPLYQEVSAASTPLSGVLLAGYGLNYPQHAHLYDRDSSAYACECHTLRGSSWDHQAQVPSAKQRSETLQIPSDAAITFPIQAMPLKSLAVNSPLDLQTNAFELILAFAV